MVKINPDKTNGKFSFDVFSNIGMKITNQLVSVSQSLQ